MLDHLDGMIRELLGRGVGNGIDVNHVAFEPPDDTWRNTVRAGQRMWLNAYLAELSENRRLRTAAPSVEQQGGGLQTVRSPVRIDCHYLISAWSPAAPNLPGINPTVDEHRVLAAAIAVLVNADPFSAAAVYQPNPVPPAFPAAFRETDFPRAVLPPDGYPKLSEFWLSMGPNQRLKPVVHLVVTIPIALLSAPAGPPVTSIRLSAQGDETFTFGGRVLSLRLPLPGGAPGPVPGAFVELLTMAGTRIATTITDADSRYRLTCYGSESYRIRIGHPVGGLQERVIALPSPVADFDVVLV